MTRNWWLTPTGKTAHLIVKRTPGRPDCWWSACGRMYRQGVWVAASPSDPTCSQCRTRETA